MHVIGSGFFGDVYKGVKTGVKIAKNITPLVGLVSGQPELASKAHSYLSLADEAMGGKFNLKKLKDGLKTAVKIGKVVVPAAAMLSGNPLLAAAATTGLSAADTALGGRMSGGAYGRQMSGGSNLSGAGNVSGGRMLKGSPEMKEKMRLLREMRRK